MVQDTDPSTLTAHTKALCTEIEQRLEQPLKEQTLGFREAGQLWDAQYRPRAVELFRAMLSFVPNSELGSQLITTIGDLRTIKSTELAELDSALCSEELAPVQLMTVRGILQRVAKTIAHPRLM
jgi:hypothetical protein